MNTDIIAVYADGGVIGRNPSPYGGTWAYTHVNADGERIAEDSGTIVPEWAGVDLVTNNLTELYAVVRGLLALPAGWSGVVYSDSQITLGRLFHGWAWNNIPEWLYRDAEAAMGRLAWTRCEPVLLDGHPSKAQLAAGIGKRGNRVSMHNVWCDKACGAQARAFLAEMNEVAA